MYTVAHSILYAVAHSVYCILLHALYTVYCCVPCLLYIVYSCTICLMYNVYCCALCLIYTAYCCALRTLLSICLHSNVNDNFHTCCTNITLISLMYPLRIKGNTASLSVRYWAATPASLWCKLLFCGATHLSAIVLWDRHIVSQRVGVAAVTSSCSILRHEQSKNYQSIMWEWIWPVAR
jgi:hypothetical protein